MEYLVFNTEKFNKYNDDGYKKNFCYHVDFKKNKYFGGKSKKRRSWVGKMIYNNGDHGDGDIYEGNWSNDRSEQGKIFYANGIGIIRKMDEEK
jgi:hypothetical protein